MSEESTGGGTDATTQTTGTETPTQSTAADASDTTGSSFSIPQEYADRSWVEKIKSQDDLFKAYDNAQSMIGKRQTPSDDASDEEWNEFFGKIGKPDSPDKYQLTDPELPEGFELPQDFKSKAQKVMHDAGLTQKQADKLYQRFLEEELSVAGQNKEAFAKQQAELDKQFDEVTNELFGDKFEEVSARSQNIIKENVPESLIPHLQSLSESDPKALAAVIALTDKMANQISDIKKQYGAEDNLGSGGQAQANSAEDVRKKIVETRSAIKNLEPFSPERKQKENDLQELQKQLQSFFN